MIVIIILLQWWPMLYYNDYVIYDDVIYYSVSISSMMIWQFMVMYSYHSSDICSDLLKCIYNSLNSIMLSFINPISFFSLKRKSICFGLTISIIEILQRHGGLKWPKIEAPQNQQIWILPMTSHRRLRGLQTWQSSNTSWGLDSTKTWED